MRQTRILDYYNHASYFKANNTKIDDNSKGTAKPLSVLHVPCQLLVRKGVYISVIIHANFLFDLWYSAVLFHRAMHCLYPCILARVREMVLVC